MNFGRLFCGSLQINQSLEPELPVHLVDYQIIHAPLMPHAKFSDLSDSMRICVSGVVLYPTS